MSKIEPGPEKKPEKPLRGDKGELLRVKQENWNSPATLEAAETLPPTNLPAPRLEGFHGSPVTPKQGNKK